MKKLVLNPLKSSTKVHSENLMTSLTNQSNSKIILMRHAESIFNHEIKKMEKLKHMMAESEYRKITYDIRFSKEFLDCEITNKGKNECHMVGKKFGNVKIKYVFVSPMRRALMTCENILSAVSLSAPEVIVYPYIFEKIEDSCDVLKDFHTNMRDYSHYNWNFFKTAKKRASYQLSFCDVWPLNIEFDSYLSSKGIKLKENITELDQDVHLEMVLKAMKMLGEEDKYIESSLKTMERLVMFKTFINSFILDKSNELDENDKILVIGHSILFKHLTAKFLDEETHEPTEHSVLQNCQLAELSFL